MKHLIRLVAFICSVSLWSYVTISHAQESTDVTKESQTEEQADKSDDAQLLLWKVPRKGAAKLLPDISLIGAFAGGYFRNDPDGEQGENPERTGFNLQSIELAIQAVIDPYVRGDIFILFKEDEVEIEEATITSLSLPANLQLKGGLLLARMGRQNTQHTEQWDFVDQSFSNRYFMGVEGFGELGLEVSILFPTPWFSEFSFEFLQGENEDNFNSPSKGDFVYLGHWKNFVDLTENLGLQLGLSAAIGKNDVARLTELYGADLFLRWRPSERKGLKWQTEYFLRRRRDAVDTLVEGGLYTQLVYQFARRWETGVRGDFIGWPAEGLEQQAVSPMLTFLASEYFRVRAQYSYVRSPGVPVNHQAFLQFVFNMGPHGAHIF